MKRFSLIRGIIRQRVLTPLKGAWGSGFCLLSMSAVLGTLGHSVAFAQDPVWPQRAVKIVVPYAAGGSSDTLGRLISVGLTEALKQPFVIENKGGAGGMIGSQQVAKSAPDGYNLVISGVA